MDIQQLAEKTWKMSKGRRKNDATLEEKNEAALEIGQMFYDWYLENKDKEFNQKTMVGYVSHLFIKMLDDIVPDLLEEGARVPHYLGWEIWICDPVDSRKGNCWHMCHEAHPNNMWAAKYLGGNERFYVETYWGFDLQVYRK